MENAQGGKEREAGGCAAEMTRFVPSDDTLQRVLPLVLEISGSTCSNGGAHCFMACKSWRRVLEARGICNKTVHLCSALAEGGDAQRLFEIAEEEESGAEGRERAMFLDVSSFLNTSLGSMTLPASLLEWLQVASQEPDVSFLSRGSASTAQALGLKLVARVDKPQERDPLWHSLTGHGGSVRSVAFSLDGKRVATGSCDRLVKIWNPETGAEVSILA